MRNMAKKEKKAKKEKLGKAAKKGKRAKREKKPRERKFAYDRAVSTLGGLVCTSAILTLLTLILLFVYAALSAR